MRCRLRAAAIIPLGPGSHPDSSSLPEGSNEPGRLSPPIWPCTTRGLPCRPDCSGRGGLLPHRFTLTDDFTFRDPLARIAFRPAEGLPPAGRRGACHRRFIFCGTVRSLNFASLARIARRTGPLALPGALPIWPLPPLPETCVPACGFVDHGVRTFLPAALLTKATQRSPGLPAKCNYTPDTRPRCVMGRDKMHWRRSKRRDRKHPRIRRHGRAAIL